MEWGRINRGLSFTVEYWRDGQSLQTFRVPAVEVGICGAYHDGIPYQPDPAATRASLSAHVRIAFDRSAVWWINTRKADNVLCFNRNLESSRGQYLGSVIAYPDFA